MPAAKPGSQTKEPTMKPLWFAAAAATLFVSNTAFANTRICVSVQQKSWYKPAAPPAPPPARANAPAGAAPAPMLGPAPAPGPEPSVRVIEPEQPPYGGPAPAAPPGMVPGTWGGTPPPPQQQQQQQPPPPQRRARPPATPHEIDPTLHLRRMLEYEVSHEPGFAAVDEGCAQRLTVELYQLESGWTVFGRYSGTEREEKVDHAELDEFAELAQRLVHALLRNKPISHTITRENVLRADSEMNLRTINGTGHLLFGMGTSMRLAAMPTAQGQDAAAATESRFITPVSIQIGYRRKLRAWGLDAFGRLNLGTENTGVRNNDLGGHVDYAKSGLLGLHFLHYTDAAGINSFYFGGGAAFEIAHFEVIRPLENRSGVTRDSLIGGGLNIDLLVGYEFLRASSVHFFGQIEANAPAYVMKTESESGGINTWMPGLTAHIGVIF
jgi:hypothetical protein